MSKALTGGEPQFGVSDKYVSASIASLVSEVAWPVAHGTLYAESVADALVLHVLRPTWQAQRAFSSSASLPDRRVRAIIEWVEAHLAEPISLGDMASTAGLSRFHFSNLFRRATGMSPYRFVTYRRLERAKHLLEFSDLPLFDIAIVTGFSSQSRFCESFKRLYGSPPLRYRHRTLK